MNFFVRYDDGIFGCMGITSIWRAGGLLVDGREDFLENGPGGFAMSPACEKPQLPTDLSVTGNIVRFCVL